MISKTWGRGGGEGDRDVADTGGPTEHARYEPLGF